MIYIGLATASISIVMLIFWVYRSISIKKHFARHRWNDFDKELSSRNALEQTELQYSSEIVPSSQKPSSAMPSGRLFKQLEQRLVQGNIYLHPGEFILIVLIWGIIIGAILYIISKSLSMFILGIIIVILLSLMYLNSCRQKKIRDFNNQIVDMLALVSNGLKAGYSLFQSVGIVAREMQPPMSQEFGRMMKQVNMGMSVEDALIGLTERIESEDLDLAVTAILIQRQVGGNLSEVLDNISHTIRERVILKNQLKVLTSQGKLSGFIICLLAPVLALIIYLMNPEFIIIMVKEPLGIVMIGIAILLQIIGILFIKKIVNIKL